MAEKELNQTQKDALMLVYTTLDAKSISLDECRRRDFIHEMKAADFRAPWSFLTKFKIDGGLYDFSEIFRKTFPGPEKKDDYGEYGLDDPALKGNEPMFKKTTRSELRKGSSASEVKMPDSFPVPKGKDKKSFGAFPKFDQKKTTAKQDKNEKGQEQPKDTEVEPKSKPTDNEKDYDTKVLEKTPIAEDTLKGVYEDHVYLVESADSTTDTVVVGISKSFKKAYEVLAKRALNGTPELTEKEARQIIDEKEVVLLKTKQIKFIACVITRMVLI